MSPSSVGDVQVRCTFWLVGPRATQLRPRTDPGLTVEVAAGGLGRGGVDGPVPEQATISRSDAAVASTVALRAQFIASLLSFGSAEPRSGYRHSAVRRSEPDVVAARRADIASFDSPPRERTEARDSTTDDQRFSSKRSLRRARLWTSRISFPREGSFSSVALISWST